MPITWIPADEVATLLDVSTERLDQHLYVVKPRTATLPSGQQQRQVAASTMWQLADAMRVPLPLQFPRPVPVPDPPPPSKPYDPINGDPRSQANVRTALRRP